MIVFNKTPKEWFQLLEKHETKIVWFAIGLFLGVML